MESMDTLPPSTATLLAEPVATRPINRVIVVGAGLAGLAAARALAHSGRDVVVLEARARIGGRCFTEHGLERGANWIHTTDGNPITTLAHQLKVDTLFVGGDTTYTGGWEQLVLYPSGGTTLSSDDKLRGILLVDGVRDELDALRRQVLADGTPDLSLAHALSIVLARRALSDQEQRALDWHFAALARDDCAADTHSLSFLWWDDGYEVYGYGDSVFADGYGALIAALAEGLDVRLDHVVEAIRYDAGGAAPVQVTTSRGVFAADAVVVTLPLGVLKAGTVRFEPPLPPAKRAAIGRLGMGSLAKVFLHFATPFWPRDQYVFGCFGGPLAERPTVIINLWKTHRQPVLQLLVGGDQGRALEHWPDEQLHSWALAILGDVFGAAIPAPSAIERTAWGRDPFARGSYAYIAVGATPADIDALAEPVANRLYFAGEATYRHHWATTQGAYVSGLREAARIVGDARLLPPRQFTENRRWREITLRASRFYNVLSGSTSDAELSERLALLADSAVFATVPVSERHVLALMFEPRSFADGQVICRIGDPATEMYLVVDGHVDVQRADGSLMHLLRRGEVVGEYGLFGTGQRTATLVARGESRALALDYQRFHRFLLAFPESALALLKLTVEQLLALRAVEGTTSLPGRPEVRAR